MKRVLDLSTRHLQAITALAHSGKFVAAAAEIGISQPTLSRLIQQAEQQLGIRLFQRGTRKVMLSAAGRDFVPTAERLLGDLIRISNALRQAETEVGGQLVIASLMSIAHCVVPAALVAFRRRYPKSYIQVREGIASAVLEDVRSGAVDFGIGPVLERRGEIAVQSAVEESCFLLLPRKHRLADEKRVKLADLAGEPMVSMPVDAGLRRLIDATAQAEGVTLNHSIVTNQFPSVCEFVAKGLGLSIVPASAVPPALSAAIRVRPLKPMLKRRIGVLHLADRPLSPASMAFLEIFRPMLLAAIRTHE